VHIDPPAREARYSLFDFRVLAEDGRAFYRAQGCRYVDVKPEPHA
jgi:hypothetical protein